jgi:hypothetical protein
MSTGTGDACYLARDLGNGSYGGDVHCLQRFFARKGYLQEEATGYYGERTATAASRWKVRDESTRAARARTRSSARAFARSPLDANDRTDLFERATTDVSY